MGPDEEVQRTPPGKMRERMLKMKRLSSMLVVSALLLALLPAGMALAKAPLRSTTDHTPGTGGLEYPLLNAWEGTISGDIDGTIEWWIDVTTWTAWPYILAREPLPNASHYTMVVKIYDGDEHLIMETMEHGTTTTANTTWRANGVVTYADPGLFPGWQGRRVHESGDFIMGENGPVSGTSLFRVN